jgi:hypothetical protein
MPAISATTASFRPHGCPAYFLGRPANVWLGACRRRTRPAHPGEQA